MAVRNKRRCRNCPGQPAPSTPESVTPQVVSLKTEGARLWKNVLFGAGTCVSMIEGYERLGVPGEPAEALRVLMSRLQEVLKKIEANDEVQPTPE